VSGFGEIVCHPDQQCLPLRSDCVFEPLPIKVNLLFQIMFVCSLNLLRSWCNALLSRGNSARTSSSSPTMSDKLSRISLMGSLPCDTQPTLQSLLQMVRDLFKMQSNFALRIFSSSRTFCNWKSPALRASLSSTKDCFKISTSAFNS